MDHHVTGGATWLRGRLCSDHSCVEVAATADQVLIRDSKNPDVPALSFTRSEWDAFLGSAKLGDFDTL